MASGDVDSERQPLLQAQLYPDPSEQHPTPQASPNGGDSRGDEDDEELSTAQLLRIMSGVFLAATLSSLDGTLIATLITPISNSLDSGTLFAWLASAYFIANAASQPLAGKLSDIYGRKTGMVFSNVLFCIGNLMCGLARSESAIIAGRIVAGLGGGGIGPIATSLASDLVPLRRRGLWQGFTNICYGIGSSLGGPIGGLINDSIGWRWAFLIQVPLTVVTIVIVLIFQNSPPVEVTVKDPTKAKWRRVDFAGATCLVSSLILMLAGLNAAGNIVPWTHPLVLATLPVSFALLVLFVVVEQKFAQEPIIPMHLLTQRTILFSCFANWFVSAARFALFFYIPMYYYLQGLSTTQIGLRLVPESIAIGATSVLFGAIMKSTGSYYWLGIVSGICVCVGTGLSTLFDTTTPMWLPILCFIFMGIGFSGMVLVTVIAMIASADHQYQAVVTSISYAFRSTGTTMGIAIASAIFQNQLTAQLHSGIGGLPNSDSLIRKLRENLGAIWELPDAWQTVAIHAYMKSFRVVFVFLVGIGVVGLVSLSLIREHKLHGKVSRKD